jgi:hypothetical protein
MWTDQHFLANVSEYVTYQVSPHVNKESLLILLLVAGST